MREMALLVPAIMLFIIGCNNNGSGAGGGGVAAGGPNPETDAPKPPDNIKIIKPKPRIDIIPTKITVPAAVRRDREFDLTLEAMNARLDGPNAGIANVYIWARKEGTDVSVGEAQFRDFRPNSFQTRTIRAKAPYRPGLWTIRAFIVPFDFTDEANNEITNNLVVVN
jgi:hypothetical protein